MTLLALPLDAVPSATPAVASVRAQVTVPLRFPDGYATTADVFTFTGLSDGKEHLLLGLGDWRRALERSGAGGAAPLVRLHSECLTGDVFGSQRCDCGPQLDRALARVAAEGGVVVYLRGHEGRGGGLLNKLQAYELQDRGFDTVDAQIELGLPVDDREYAAGAAILADLGIPALRLLTNNPMKVNAMRELDIEVVAVERLSISPLQDNRAYLRTKRDRLGHDLVVDTADTGASA